MIQLARLHVASVLLCPYITPAGRWELYNNASRFMGSMKGQTDAGTHRIWVLVKIATQSMPRKQYRRSQVVHEDGKVQMASRGSMAEGVVTAKANLGWRAGE